MEKSKRIDSLLVSLGLCKSRAKAQSLISSGFVYADGMLVKKNSEMYSFDVRLKIINDDCIWVSRAGLKLEYAIDYFDIKVKNKVCLDIGASTGGFTHVLFSYGAKKIFAVDVGTEQLDSSLKVYSNIIDISPFNAKNLNSKVITEKVDILVCDVSFISVKKVLPYSFQFVNKSGAYLVILIKPQFEVGREHINSRGVVKSTDLHRQSCNDVKEFVSGAGWLVHDIIESPITGRKGNKEFLLYARKR